MLKILTTPNPILIQVAKPVIHFDKKLLEIISEMSKTLLATSDPKGVGLAAPQVGLSIRLFLTKPTEKSGIQAFINPVIYKNNFEEQIQTESVPQSASIESRSKEIKKSSKRLLEGCLSIPNIWGHVSREKSVMLKWQDENGNTHTKLFRGFMATIIQHEIDHLNGVLFTKHVMEQQEKLFKSYKNKSGEDEFEEISL